MKHITTLPIPRLLLFFTVCVWFAQCYPTNYTIDDQNGDSLGNLIPTYSPAGGWSTGETCTECFVRPNPAIAYMNTWHDSTWGPGDEVRDVTIRFNGSAVYAYCILANNVENATTFTDLTILLDNEQVSTYQHYPSTSTVYEYNTPVYSNDSIPDGSHELILRSGGGINSSLILFDYITYTLDLDASTSSSSTSPSSGTPLSSSSLPSSTPTSSNNHLGSILGGTLGGALGLIGSCLLALILLRRRQRAGKMSSNTSSPGIQDPFMEGTLPRAIPLITPYTHRSSLIQTGDTNGGGSGDIVEGGDHARDGVGNGWGANLTTRDARVKAERLQEEIISKIQAQERFVAALRQPNEVTDVSGQIIPITGSSADFPDADSRQALLQQIDALTREVERLREEQRLMLVDADEFDAPPPQYEEHRLALMNVHH